MKNWFFKLSHHFHTFLWIVPFCGLLKVFNKTNLSPFSCINSKPSKEDAKTFGTISNRCAIYSNRFLALFVPICLSCLYPLEIHLRFVSPPPADQASLKTKSGPPPGDSLRMEKEEFPVGDFPPLRKDSFIREFVLC